MKKALLSIGLLGLLAVGGCTDAEFLHLPQPAISPATIANCARTPGCMSTLNYYQGRIDALQRQRQNQPYTQTPDCAMYHYDLTLDYQQAQAEHLNEPGNPYGVGAPQGWISPFPNSAATRLYNEGCR